MSVSRRTFVKTLGVGGAGVLAAPLVPAHRGLLAESVHSAAGRGTIGGAIRLSRNENPNGPPDEIVAAIRDAAGRASRYALDEAPALRAAIARARGVKPESVLIGVGSTEILLMAVNTFCSPSRVLVTTAPTFEDPATHAERLHAPVKAIRVDAQLKLDLDAMAAAAVGAGLVFLCNPNNPTATVHSARDVRDFVHRVLEQSPDTTILIDEAYHEYVDDPAYATSLPLVQESRRVLVSRTFSKIYGMAGMRCGYVIAHPATIAAMETIKLNNSLSQPTYAAAMAALSLPSDVIERERQRNREAKEYTVKALAQMGVTGQRSDTNFIMVDVRRPALEFQQGCEKRGILVGRPFPPLTTHARISIGTMDEMRTACEVFRGVLRPT